jgi:hypothetical protein
VPFVLAAQIAKGEVDAQAKGSMLMWGLAFILWVAFV